MTLKEQFPHFYRPDKKRTDEAYKSGWFVFDTSSLLNIFGLELADKVYTLLEQNEKRIKIPFHVAEEYHKDVHSTIAKSLSYTRSGIEELSKKEEVNLFRNKYKKYFTNSTVADYSDKLSKLIDQFIENAKTQQLYLRKQYDEGELQEKLSSLLGDKLLPRLEQATIDDIENITGPQRYKDKIAPGYEDAGKDENQYGDLIIWFEILEFAKTSDKDIIFVTDDVKPDMIYKPSGYTFGPHLSMLKEFHDANPNISYHVCTLESFIHHVNEVSKVMSESEIEQVKMDMEENTSQRRRLSLKTIKGGSIWPTGGASLLGLNEAATSASGLNVPPTAIDAFASMESLGDPFETVANTASSIQEAIKKYGSMPGDPSIATSAIVEIPPKPRSAKRIDMLDIDENGEQIP